MNDITLTGTWTTLFATSVNAPFTGTIDGRGFTISGLSANVVNGDDGIRRSGLIGRNSGTIKNLKVAGTNSSSISAGVGQGFALGGLVGDNRGTIRDCIGDVYMNISGTANSLSNVGIGGLVGYQSSGLIRSCYTKQNTKGVANTYVGGLVGVYTNPGLSSTYIGNCYTLGVASGGAVNKAVLAQVQVSSSYYSDLWYRGSPTDARATYESSATALYNITHNVYDTGSYQWDFSSTGPWSNESDTVTYPPLKSNYTLNISGSVTGLGNKAMKCIVTDDLGKQTVFSATSSSDNFTFTSVSTRLNWLHTIFVDTATTAECSTLVGVMAKAKGAGNITGITMAKGKLYIGSNTSDLGTALTSANMTTAWYNDGDVSYTVSSNAITTRNGASIIVPSGITFTQSANVTVATSGDLTVDGTWTTSAGSVNTSVGDLIVSGSFTGNGAFADITNTGTIVLTGGTITGNITSDDTFTATASRIPISSTTIDNTGTMAINGNFTADTEFSGDIDLNASTFVTAGKTYIFENGKTYDYADMIMTGTLADRITINSDSAGNRFTFDGNGSTFTFVDIKDCQASTTNINAIRCIDSGGNDNKEASPHIVFWSYCKAFVLAHN
jgi:hypothetical protein